MKQIDKRVARKLFSKGCEVWITASNMRPQDGILLNATIYRGTAFFGISFDRICNCFTYYNCDNVRGRYPRFYVEETTEEKG